MLFADETQEFDFVFPLCCIQIIAGCFELSVGDACDFL